MMQPEGNKRGGPETEFLGAKKRRDDHVPTGFHLAVASGRVFCRASEFMTSTCCVSARPISQGIPACLMDESGEAPGSAVVAADDHHVGLAFCDPRGNGAHPDFGNELYGNARLADWRFSSQK